MKQEINVILLAEVRPMLAGDLACLRGCVAKANREADFLIAPLLCK